MKITVINDHLVFDSRYLIYYWEYIITKYSSAFLLDINEDGDKDDRAVMRNLSIKSKGL